MPLAAGTNEVEAAQAPAGGQAAWPPIEKIGLLGDCTGKPITLESSKIVFRRGSAPDPAGGAYDARKTP